MEIIERIRPIVLIDYYIDVNLAVALSNHYYFVIIPIGEILKMTVIHVVVMNKNGLLKVILHLVLSRFLTVLHNLSS